MQRLHPLVLCDASLRQAPFRRQRVFPASTSPTWKAGKTALPSSWVWLTTLRDTSAVLDFSSQYAYTRRVMSMQHAIPDPATNYSALFCRWLGSHFQTQLLDFHDILTCKHVICTLLPQPLPSCLNPPVCSAMPAQLDSLILPDKSPLYSFCAKQQIYKPAACIIWPVTHSINAPDVSANFITPTRMQNGSGHSCCKYNKGACTPQYRHLCLCRMRSAFSMKQDASQQSGISAKEAAKLLSTGQTDELMDVIYNKYVEYRKQHDLVIIEGLTGFEPGLGNVNELNAKVAATLETPVLMVLDSRTKDGFSSANDLANSVVSPALPNFTHPSANLLLCLSCVYALCLSCVCPICMHAHSVCHLMKVCNPTLLARLAYASHFHHNAMCALF